MIDATPSERSQLHSRLKSAVADCRLGRTGAYARLEDILKEWDWQQEIRSRVD